MCGTDRLKHALQPASMETDEQQKNGGKHTAGGSKDARLPEDAAAGAGAVTGQARPMPTGMLNGTCGKTSLRLFVADGRREAAPPGDRPGNAAGKPQPRRSRGPCARRIQTRPAERAAPGQCPRSGPHGRGAFDCRPTQPRSRLATSATRAP